MVDSIRRQPHLVSVHINTGFRSSSNVDAHGVKLEGVTQEPGHNCVDQWVVEKVQELIAFVGKTPTILFSSANLMNVD